MPQNSQFGTDIEQDLQGSLNVILDLGRGGGTGGEQGSELFSVCQNQNGNYRWTQCSCVQLQKFNLSQLRKRDGTNWLMKSIHSKHWGVLSLRDSWNWGLKCHQDTLSLPRCHLCSLVWVHFIVWTSGSPPGLERNFISRGTFGNIWRWFLLVTTGGRVLLISSRLRPRMLLNILQCPEQTPQQRINLTPNINSSWENLL